MKKTQKKLVEKEEQKHVSGSETQDLHDENHHSHEHEDKELYIIKADGNIQKVDLQQEKGC